MTDPIGRGVIDWAEVRMLLFDAPPLEGPVRVPTNRKLFATFQSTEHRTPCRIMGTPNGAGQWAKTEHTSGTAPFFSFSYARALKDSFVCECGGDQPSGTLKLMVGRSCEALSPSLKDTLSEGSRGHAGVCGKRYGPPGGLLFFRLRREPAARECCVVLLSGRVFVFSKSDQRTVYVGTDAVLSLC